MKKYIYSYILNFLIAFIIISPIIGFFIWKQSGFIMMDWRDIFIYSGRKPFDPYSVSVGFNYPAWTAILLTPISLLSFEWGRIVNVLLNMLIAGIITLKYGGSKFSLLITLTSFPMLFLIGTSNVEWIPMMGLLIQNPIFILTKPQSGFLILLIWIKKQIFNNEYILGVLIFLWTSFIVWGYWPEKMFINMQLSNALMYTKNNLGFLWPYGIIVGIIMIYFALKKNDETLAVIASWFFTPYIACHSLIMGFSLLSAKKPKISLLLSICLYIIMIIRWNIL